MAYLGCPMCPPDVLSRLSVLTSSGTIIVPRLVSRLTYDHLFSVVQEYTNAAACSVSADDSLLELRDCRLGSRWYLWYVYHIVLFCREAGYVREVGAS